MNKITQNVPINSAPATELDQTDFEVRSLDTVCINESLVEEPWWKNFKFLVVGALFGILLVKAEIISWYRMQEMFRLQSFHMFGVIGSAVVVGMFTVWLIRKFNVRTVYGEDIIFHRKKLNKGNIIGGLTFGMGWALTGACPGPLYAQLGTGLWITVVTLASAILGTWTYGFFRHRLPH